jgi:hypothetical protein
VRAAWLRFADISGFRNTHGAWFRDEDGAFDPAAWLIVFCLWALPTMLIIAGIIELIVGLIR